MRQKSQTIPTIMRKIMFEAIDTGVIDMTMWKLKGCPRCGGDLFIKKEIDAWEEQCLQCSYNRELKKISRFSQPHPLEMEEEKEPVHTGRGRRSRHSSSEWNYE